jgi:hypothetical protein
MNENKISIKQYEQAADERVSLGGIKWEKKWDVCVQCDSREEADRVRAALAQPDVPETDFGKIKPVPMKFQIYKQTPPRGRELEPINSALFPWVYDQDPSSGNTASMWVTPVATLPPQREWQGLTTDELQEISEFHFHGGLSGREFYDDIEAKLKEKNT